MNNPKLTEKAMALVAKAEWREAEDSAKKVFSRLVAEQYTKKLEVEPYVKPVHQNHKVVKNLYRACTGFGYFTTIY